MISTLRCGRVRTTWFAAIFCWSVGTVQAAVPNGATPGHLWVTSENQLREYTPNGVLVQTINVPHPQSAPDYDRGVAGVLVDAHGKVQVANFAFSFQSYLSTFNPVQGTWHHTPISAHVTNTADGDLAQYDDKVIIYGYEINVTTFSSSHLPTTVFPPNRGGSGISIGQDGLMYAVNAGSPQEAVRVTDPANNFSLVGDLSLRDSQGIRRDVRGLAATTDGIIFAADWDGTIYKYNPSGVLLGQLSTGVHNLVSLEMDQSGNLVAGSRSGRVVLTTTALSTPFVFSAGSDVVYANFITTPEPSTIALTVAALAAFPTRRRKSVPHNRV